MDTPQRENCQRLLGAELLLLALDDEIFVELWIDALQAAQQDLRIG